MGHRLDTPIQFLDVHAFGSLSEPMQGIGRGFKVLRLDMLPIWSTMTVASGTCSQT